MMRGYFRYAVMGLLLALQACAPPDKLELKPASFAQLPGWDQEAHQEALQAFAAHCQSWASGKSGVPKKLAEWETRAADWKTACGKAVALASHQENSIEAKRFFETYFTPVLATNRGEAKGLFTGYYLPQLNGSRVRTKHYSIPVYAKPKDEIASQFSRQEIDQGALEGKGLEIAWVDDKIALFFLQIQGSGQIKLPDGKIMYVGYAGANGQPYRSIGAELVRRGELNMQQVNQFTIQQWLRDHPDQADALLWSNPSYVFFKRREQPSAIGAANVPLTPERSIAVDPRFLTYGLPVYLDTYIPDTNGSTQPFQRLLIAQDTGGAIRGPVRADIFFGAGQRASSLAGLLKQPGQYYLLLPNALAERIAAENQ